MTKRGLRLSIPSKGRLQEETIAFLAACGFEIKKNNPRQYEGTMPAIPGLTVLFQRPTDIVISLRDGSVDFGITGLDVLEEFQGHNNDIMVLHEALGYGKCSLNLAVPEEWADVDGLEDLQRYAASQPEPLRIATKFPLLTGKFLKHHHIPHTIVGAEGTLEIAPAIGYADMISDLVSSGQTLNDNHLKKVEDCCILSSQSVLAANHKTLSTDPNALAVARQLLEFIEAYIRAENNVSIYANIRGDSADVIATRIFEQQTIGGLNGPTISRIIRKDGDQSWYALHIIVHRDEIFNAIKELRSIGGSGVVVTPVTYIFEEEPPRYKAMLKKLKIKQA